MHKHHKHKSKCRHRYEEDDKLQNTSRHKSESVESPRNKYQKSECYAEFDWSRHKSTLNKIFFRDQDIIKRGTEEYNEFWPFLRKYEAVQRRNYETKASKNFESGKNSDSQERYDGQRKINFKFNTEDVDELMTRGFLFKDDEDENQISKEKILEFQHILLLYINFLQKQKFNKLQKLRESQANLPIANHRKDILDAVSKNQVVLIAGDTGCGKSTQIPQYLLSAGYKNICCTQPRRIACISLCKRVSYETLDEYGSEVGYQIRFEKDKTQFTRILFLTEGLLLRQVATDSLLSSYDVIILDEVHERHLSCDFLIGIVKCLTYQRPKVKIIFMSATINIQLFANYFKNCPVIQVPGRLFPIEVYYRPILVENKSSKTSRLNPGPYIQILQLIDHKYPSNERGDVLMFLSGMTEISTVVDAAEMYAEQNKKWIILPLHSTLSIDVQDKVFGIAPEGVRKCIVSTNIAETSVTIDGVRFVVDSGKVKEMSYDPNCRMQCLKEFWISRASAEQRKGRAGRTGPGVCFRLYSEKEYDAMDAYSSPEIQRVPLDSLLLQMISIGLPDARKFPFLEAPSNSSIEISLQNLKNEGALTDDETLTVMGQMLSRLPVDVTIGKMLILGSVFHLVDPVMTLAAVISVQSPFTNQSLKNQDIIAAQKTLHSTQGDPFTLLNAYHKWLEIKSDRNENSRKWCKRHGIEEQRFYEVTKLRKQFRELLQDSGLIVNRKRMSTSTQRAYRHGELKHLKDLKRSFHHAPRSSKMLKLDSEFVIENENDDNDEIDIKDIEFQISNDKLQIKDLMESSQTYSYKDFLLLKLILCSGLYPQLALSDEHNSYKTDSEQLFHTKEKSFVCLHPNGVFALQPDILHLSELDIQQIHGFHSQIPLSIKHQLIAFVSFLETTKPYLVNCVRIPAAHTLLLLAHSLDTNHDFTKVIADSWLELRFPDAEEAQNFLLCSIKLRDMWQDLLQQKLMENQSHDENYEETPEIKKKRTNLERSIKEFLHIEILFTVRRLLSADLKSLYIGSSESNCAINPNILKDVTENIPHPVKGGLILRDYLTYNCLSDIDQSHLQYLQKHWKCPRCEQEMLVTLLEQIRHQEKCQKENEKQSMDDDYSKMDPLKKEFNCQKCQKVLYLTAVEILKHKQKHLSSENILPSCSNSSSNK
ncbi:probable ATP-dependent RNA helicase DHX34 [Centruroides sculpturatus]|uniref:probable ATP-dependent RNA helicase DHX34 n=1 Tax=Centruroides sculpturatus TaxID=218467 RepID=UPI000C6DFC11|nr:probable ATP-dependent RNA helicase DHX34 [Centruroides sculpturatus]